MRNYTFVLNLKDASTNTYQTWVTVRIKNGVLERKSNAEGNGQTWEVFGYKGVREFKLFSTNANEAAAARIVAHVVRTVGLRCNVGGFGVAWAKAEVVESIASRRTGRKLTSAPSIRLGRVERDKNRNMQREKVATIDMAAAMTARKSNPKIVFFSPRFVIDPATLRFA